ncbi:CocE/NonD family hydrolase [Streptomyces sp. AC495_CC817]|uniref:CocE/NonD family hydrolase n=1 Tax=Streptomyces sp. AC495_CC817 TaxID=2823900 RepID=UPI001C268F72|nr:CocE/NonD family hydrolase [Streptomyces sp. AC495_CC817]
MTPPRDARSHAVAADDGALLRGWAWEPPHPRGVVLIRTPYGAWRDGDTARSWVRRGYRCIVHDVRGRHSSEGEWHPYLAERGDGRAVVETLRAESPGLPLVVSGGSYAAHTALEAARAVDVDALVLLVPALGLAETAWDAEGRPQLHHRIGWWHQHGRGPHSLPPLRDDELAERVERARTIGVHHAAVEWGWSPETLSGWRRLWSAPPLDLDRAYGGVDAPLLLIRGDDDFFHADAGRLADAWTARIHVVDGPWGHRLAADIADDEVRARLRSAGGLGRVLDDWLAENGLPSAASAPVRRPVPIRRTRSAFEPETGRWRHERTA